MGRDYKFTLVGKKIDKMDDFIYENINIAQEDKVEKINEFHPCAHLINIDSSSSVFTL